MIANILQLELNSIINVISPSKVIQFLKNYIPYFDNDIKQNLQTKQNLLKHAMTTNDPNDWRNFKNFRNNLTRLIDKAKTKFYGDKFSNSNDKWQTLKNLTESKKNTSPNNIIFNNISILSPKHIANIANEFFIKKKYNSK